MGWVVGSGWRYGLRNAVSSLYITFCNLDSREKREGGRGSVLANDVSNR